MTFSKKSFLGVIFVVAASAALVFSLQAGASRGHHERQGKLFRSGLVGNVLTDPPIHGVNRAGAPWVLDKGSVKLSRNGRFDLRVKGLVLASNGTTGTVTMIAAHFFCAPDSTVAAFTAGPVPLAPDGDVIAHALIDAILGAAGLGDIGTLFPSGAPEWEGASSLDLLSRAYEQVRDAGWELVNADCILVGEEPRIAPVREAMRVRLAGALAVEPDLVNVRATTTDGLGFAGRGEGLAALAVALLDRA